MGLLSSGRSVSTPYEGLDLANQIGRKLGVSDRKLEGRYSIFHCWRGNV